MVEMRKLTWGSTNYNEVKSRSSNIDICFHEKEIFPKHFQNFVQAAVLSTTMAKSSPN